MKNGRSTTIVIQGVDGSSTLTYPGPVSVTVIHNKDFTEGEIDYAMRKEENFRAHFQLWQQMHPGSKTPMPIRSGPGGRGNIL